MQQVVQLTFFFPQNIAVAEKLNSVKTHTHTHTKRLPAKAQDDGKRVLVVFSDA